MTPQRLVIAAGGRKITLRQRTTEKSGLSISGNSAPATAKTRASGSVMAVGGRRHQRPGHHANRDMRAYHHGRFSPTDGGGSGGRIKSTFDNRRGCHTIQPATMTHAAALLAPDRRGTLVLWDGAATERWPHTPMQASRSLRMTGDNWCGIHAVLRNEDVLIVLRPFSAYMPAPPPPPPPPPPSEPTAGAKVCPAGVPCWVGSLHPANARRAAMKKT